MRRTWTSAFESAPRFANSKKAEPRNETTVSGFKCRSCVAMACSVGTRADPDLRTVGVDRRRENREFLSSVLLNHRKSDVGAEFFQVKLSAQ